ncbi:MAG: hypothetical protein AAF485_16710, partial [Chloroflexota bacterium]
ATEGATRTTSSASKDKIEEVKSQNLCEGYRIIKENDILSPTIEWVDWIQQSNDKGDYKVEVYFSDDSSQVLEKDIILRQIWHEYVEQENMPSQ